MSKFGLLPKFLSKLHRRRATPYIGILLFGFIGGLLALSGGIYLVASLYSFGALLSYFLVNYCHILLRKIDKDAYRPWKTPANIKIDDHEISIIAIMGVLSTGALFILTAVYHIEGRLLGFAWVIAGLLLFYAYRYYSAGKIQLDIARKLIPPALPYIKVLVYVPLFINPKVIVERVNERLSEVNEVHLVSVIPRNVVKKDGVDVSELTRIKSIQMRVLRKIKGNLEERFRCKVRLLVADDVESALLRYVAKHAIDQVAVPIYKRRRVKRKVNRFTKLMGRVELLFLSE